MRIVFYAPLKAPDARTPSGDRRMARLLVKALESGGHEVFLASRLRTRDGKGDPDWQARVARVAERYVRRFVRCCESGTIRRPNLWFTYHLYYKAPDLIGPAIAEALGIPYVVAEASHAPKRAKGPWAGFHARAEAALARADLVVGFNSRDRACVEPCLKPAAHYLQLRPFLDVLPPPVRGKKDGTPLLLAVGMMRPGAKVSSYRVLAEALALLPEDRAWSLRIVGDGSGRGEVESLFARFGARVRFEGAVEAGRLSEIYGEADLFVWPAVEEAYGMALLEAQAAGLPVIAGDAGGVPDIVTDGMTGLLSPEGDAISFAANLDRLLADPARAAAFGAAGRAKVTQLHGLDRIAAELNAALPAAVR